LLLNIVIPEATFQICRAMGDRILNNKQSFSNTPGKKDEILDKQVCGRDGLEKHDISEHCP